ncbi:MAG TPA: S8 family peptidase [Solirubrobacteraceae bacterium]|nr:S8 family peptidase [Solirubrobacteraceae bacterium]
MLSLPANLRAAAAALAVGLIVVPAAHASSFGPAMSPADVRSMQTQGVREIVLDRRPGVGAAQMDELRAQAGVTYLGPGPLPGTELDRAPAGTLASAVAQLEREPQVAYAEPDGEVHATATPNDPFFAQQWALQNSGQSILGTGGTAGDDIGASYVWPHATGAGVTVAVVDTGVDATAPDLAGQLVPGYSWVNGNSDTQDQNGHGTHVTGIIAAVQNNGVGVSGVAPGARVMPLQALDSSGDGTDADVAAAFNYAGDAGVPIVNASLGSSTPSQEIEQAIAAHPNTLYVVAAGNSGTDNDNPSTPFYPCDLTEANVVCVGASDQNDQPASFSDYGPTSVDLFAPGVNILSTWLSSGGGAQYAYADGTSMATPMVSATLALMLSRNSSLSAAELKRDLLQSVDQEPQFAGESSTGGELDAAAAVALAGGDPPYAPPGNRMRPVVSGAATAGSTLTVSTGSWSRAPTGYAYQWDRCWLGVCLPIAGATSSSYTVPAADDGAILYAVVTASNAAGSTRAMSTNAPQQLATRSPSAASPGGGGAAAAGSASSGSTKRKAPRRKAPRHKARVHASRRRARRPATKRRKKTSVRSRSGRSARS